jgi:hypothetical protein
MKGEWRFAIDRHTGEVHAKLDDRDVGPADAAPNPEPGPPPIEPYTAPPPIPYLGPYFEGHCVLAKDAGPPEPTPLSGRGNNLNRWRAARRAGGP